MTCRVTFTAIPPYRFADQPNESGHGNTLPEFVYAQGLLRELYQIQGHSSSDSMEWDWSKYDLPTRSGGTDIGAGDVVVSSGDGGNATPMVTAAELIQGTIPWQAIPVDAKTSIKINVSRRRPSKTHT